MVTTTKMEITKGDVIPARRKQTKAGVIPKDWEITSLGDIATIATGSTPPTQDLANYGDEYPFVSPVDIGEAKYVTNTEKRLSKKGFTISRRFPAGSILFVSMDVTRNDLVGKALDSLRGGLGPFVEREVKQAVHAGLLDSSRSIKCEDQDVAALLRLMWDCWNEVVRTTLSRRERNLVSELLDERRRWAHQEPFSTRDAWRALDSAQRLLEAVSAPQARDIDSLMQEIAQTSDREHQANQHRPVLGERRNIENDMANDGLYRRLVQIARDQMDPITYGEAGSTIGLPGGDWDLWRHLDEINHYEHRNGRPMLSALVVSGRSVLPGKGFFACARLLGHDVSDDAAFWRTESRRVYEYWRDR